VPPPLRNLAQSLRTIWFKPGLKFANVVGAEKLKEDGQRVTFDEMFVKRGRSFQQEGRKCDDDTGYSKSEAKKKIGAVPRKEGD
jgi:hypothetical protein